MYQKSWCYDLEFRRYRVWWTEIGNFGSFLALSLPWKPEKSGFWKMKKITRNIVILHMCTKNHNHMMYSSSDTEWDRHKFLSIWAILSPFTRLMTQQIKILKKWKKHLEMSSFYTCVPKLTTMWYMLPGMWSVTDNCHYELFFALLPH